MPDLLVFLPACFAMNLAFGPNNLLSVSYGASHGVAFACRAGLGRIAAFVPMIALTAAGLGVLLSASALAFSAVKVAGALYLLWIGVQILRAASRGEAADAAAARDTLPAALRREALVALGNPKAMLIFAAFFPQFVDPADYWTGYAVVGGIFLALELAAIALYAAVGRAVARASGGAVAWFQRVSGATMIGFAVLLLLARRPGEA